MTITAKQFKFVCDLCGQQNISLNDALAKANLPGRNVMELPRSEFDSLLLALGVQPKPAPTTQAPIQPPSTLPAVQIPPSLLPGYSPPQLTPQQQAQVTQTTTTYIQMPNKLEFSENSKGDVYIKSCKVYGNNLISDMESVYTRALELRAKYKRVIAKAEAPESYDHEASK